jgi:hypothetical protein
LTYLYGGDWRGALTNTGRWKAIASMVMRPKHSPRAYKREKKKQNHQPTFLSKMQCYLLGNSVEEWLGGFKQVIRKGNLSPSINWRKINKKRDI